MHHALNNVARCKLDEVMDIYFCFLHEILIYIAYDIHGLLYIRVLRMRREFGPNFSKSCGLRCESLYYDVIR